MTSPKTRVQRAAAQVAASLQRRDAAILEWWIDGASLRDIAEAAGLSHTEVRRILQRAGVNRRDVTR
jgi:DNA-binding CsgD family transcriptional regulator